LTRTLPVLLAVLLIAGCGVINSAAGTVRYRAASANMEPTIKQGQRVTAHKVGHDGYQARRGDIVVYRAPASAGSAVGQNILSRVIAIGGDTINCCDPSGKVTIGGSPIDEPYIHQDAPLDGPTNSCQGRRFGPVTLTPDQLFVMGDNRQQSGDSRCAGPIATNTVVAVVT
jgi:signal peptidase I